MKEKKKCLKITWRKYGRHVEFSAITREALSVLSGIALCNCYGARILIHFSSSAHPRKSSGRKSQLKKRGVSKTVPYATCTSPIMHLICPPKFLHNLCFSFLLGITAVPREIENNAYANFVGGVGGRGEGQIRCIMGDVQVAYSAIRLIWHISSSFTLRRKSTIATYYFRSNNLRAKKNVKLNQITLFETFICHK